MHKRKHRRSVRDDNWEQSTHAIITSHVQSTFSTEDTFVPDPCLYIQAHEADIIRWPPSAAARSLEFQRSSPMNDSRQNTGSGLIRWGESDHSHRDDKDTTDAHESTHPQLWVDSDRRLTFARQSEDTQERPLSPNGWSDLPSDSEDTFFFSPDELEDYRREKRRRLMDRDRDERLRALAAIEGEEGDPDPWGGSDEEPDDTQRELICRTASHIISSPNPAQLEMRILANYSTDKRFAFLRGRWSRVWRIEKERAKQRLAEEAQKTQSPPVSTPLGGLAGYGDSDSDGGSKGDNPTEEPEDARGAPPTQGQHSNEDEDEVKEARRARAREWSARRRAEQS
ncbi:hypothetical protein JVU11DRAFT_6847 [Chiua virens]|nr:hypothetical protein JVU11DRAFT_6847 [Chiua virens]